MPCYLGIVSSSGEASQIYLGRREQPNLMSAPTFHSLQFSPKCLIAAEVF